MQNILRYIIIMMMIVCTYYSRSISKIINAHLIITSKKREYRDGIKRKETRLGWCGTQCMHGA